MHGGISGIDRGSSNCSASRSSPTLRFWRRAVRHHPARAFVRQCRRARERDRRRRIGRRSRQRSDERLGRISAPDSDDPCVDSRAGLLCCRGGSPSKRHTHRHMPVRHPILLSDYRGVDERDMANQVSPEVQGRVFAIRRMFSWSSIPIAYLCSGFLAEHIFNPMLVEGGALADTLGRIVGVGPGRGIAVMFLATALLTIVVVLIASLNRAFRGVEDPSVANAPVTLPSTGNKSA